VGTFTLDANLALVFFDTLTVGVRADYRFITQFTAVDPSVGNRRGSFLSPASPYLGIALGRIYASAAVVMLGDYELTNPTISGDTVKYDSPSGFRVDLKWMRSHGIEPAIFYESVSFARASISGKDSSLANPVTLSHYGAGIVYSY
jgi:hypothetical protein